MTVYPRLTTELNGDYLRASQDWDSMVRTARDVFEGFTPLGTFVSPYSFVVSKDSHPYYYASNAYQTIYGGASNAGSVDGTDASAVINAAIIAANTAGGGVVYLKAGEYILTSPIRIRRGISLVGEGWQAVNIGAPGEVIGGTILRADTGYTGNIIQSSLTGAETDYPDVFYVIRDLLIDGSQAGGGTGIGIHLVNPVGVHIVNCYIYSMYGQGLFVDGSDSTTIYVIDTWFTANKLDQIAFGVCYQAFFIRDVFEFTADAYLCINLQAVHSFLIDQCYGEVGVNAIGVLGTSSEGMLTNNYFYLYTNDCIQLAADTYRITIRNNYFSTITNNAISLHGSGHEIGVNNYWACGTPIFNAGFTNTRFLAYPFVNSGSAIGTSPITVAHGLVGTPSIVMLGANVNITPVKTSWVADATNITIFHDAGATANISWFAEYKP